MKKIFCSNGETSISYPSRRMPCVGIGGAIRQIIQVLAANFAVFVLTVAVNIVHNHRKGSGDNEIYP